MWTGATCEDHCAIYSHGDPAEGRKACGDPNEGTYKSCRWKVDCERSFHAIFLRIREDYSQMDR